MKPLMLTRSDALFFEMLYPRRYIFINHYLALPGRWLWLFYLLVFSLSQLFKSCNKSTALFVLTHQNAYRNTFKR